MLYRVVTLDSGHYGVNVPWKRARPEKMRFLHCIWEALKLFVKKLQQILPDTCSMVNLVGFIPSKWKILKDQPADNIINQLINKSMIMAMDWPISRLTGKSRYRKGDSLWGIDTLIERIHRYAANAPSKRIRVYALWQLIKQKSFLFLMLKQWHWWGKTSDGGPTSTTALMETPGLELFWKTYDSFCLPMGPWMP